MSLYILLAIIIFGFFYFLFSSPPETKKKIPITPDDPLDSASFARFMATGEVPWVSTSETSANKPVTINPCAICGKASDNSCSRCRSVYYCSQQHNKQVCLSATIRLLIGNGTHLLMNAHRGGRSISPTASARGEGSKPSISPLTNPNHVRLNLP